MYSIKRKQHMMPRVNFERVAGYIPVLLLVIYIVLYKIILVRSTSLLAFNITYFSIIVPIFIVDGVRNFIESFSKIHFKESHEELDKVTVVIACKDGEDIIDATLTDLLKRFSPQNIIVASNGSTDDTCQISRAKGVVCLEYTQPLGKVRAINAALSSVKTPYVLLLDDDTLVGNAQIPTGLLDQGYEGVAFRVLVRVSTWITKFQQYEYIKSSDIGKRYHNRNASVQNISGAIGLFKTRHLIKQIRRHTGEFSGEDLQRTLLIHLTNKARGVVLSNSVVYTAPPNTFRMFFGQRIFGWFPGLYANFGNYFKILTRDRMPTALRLDAFYNLVFMMLLDILRFLCLPILILFPWYFAIMYITYLALDLSSFLRTKRHTPFWVYITYPLFGLLGFITRLCAFSVFIYRRIAVKLSRRDFLDDYRTVRAPAKFTALIASNVVIGLPAMLNIRHNYLAALFKLISHL